MPQLQFDGFHAFRKIGAGMNEELMPHAGQMMMQFGKDSAKSCCDQRKLPP
jgi:hypothetical protein